MSSNRQALPDDPGDSGAFNGPFWSSRKGVGLGLDVECTKAAVDLQSLSERTSEMVISTALETLRRATGADVAFLAQLDESAERFASAVAARGDGITVDPAAFKGRELAKFPYLQSR